MPDKERTHSSESNLSRESTLQPDMHANDISRPMAQGSRSSLTAKTGDDRPIRQSKNKEASKVAEDGGSATDSVGHNPDMLVVDWNGPDDPENPKNWSERKKWAAAFAVSSFTFISPVSSSMVAPAAFQIAQDLHIYTNIEVAMTISVFVLAYAVGPLVLGPLSEIYGRSRVLQLANLFFLAFNLACGFAQNKGQLIAFRFLSGIGGSAPLAVGGGVLSDMWDADKRGKAVGIYSLAPLLGPAIGPIAGGWIADRSTWRWCFWSVTIADAIVQLAGLRYLRETYAPVLLKWKAHKIKKDLAADPEKGGSRIVRTVYQLEKGEMTFREFLLRALCRPFVLFAQEPIIQLFGVYLAFVYGTIYLVLTTVPDIFTNLYHQSSGIVGLHYIALGIGLSIAAQVNSRLLDKTYKYQKERNNGIGKPEFRLLAIIPGTFLLPIGLLITGWCAQERAHWIGTDIGFALVGAGAASTFQGLQAYVIDSFPRYAASALAAVSCFRSLAGFGFPLFAPYMYAALGYGKGDTILAAFCLGVGCPALVLFYIYGERIRAMSKRTGAPQTKKPFTNTAGPAT